MLSTPVRRARVLAAAALATAAALGSACAPATAQNSGTAASMTEGPKLVIPLANPEEGKKLFVGKGCVVCHQVNGVGGKAAPPLDADSKAPYFDVFDFAARMWRGAPTMITLQEMELGYQIELSGEELAHLAAFASDPKVQSSFSEKDIPEVIRDWMVDEVYQELDPNYMTR